GPIQLAAMPGSFHAQPTLSSPQIGPADGGGAGTHDLRPAGQSSGPCPASGGGQELSTTLSQGCPDASRRRRGDSSVHGVSHEALAAIALNEPTGAFDAGDRPPHRCRGDLPKPGFADSFGRRGSHGTAG